MIEVGNIEYGNIKTVTSNSMLNNIEFDVK